MTSDQRLTFARAGWRFLALLVLAGCADNLAPEPTPPAESAIEVGQTATPARSPWTIRNADFRAFPAAPGETVFAGPAASNGTVEAGRLTTGSSISFAGTYTRIEPVFATLFLDPDPDALEAAWSVDSDLGGSWSGLGDTRIDSLPAANYTVTWSDVAGWQTPAMESVSLAAGGTATLSGLYVALPDTTPPAPVAIPTAAEWTDEGIVLEPGQAGEWDAILWGGFGATAVRRSGTTFLYYQGASDYDEALGTVVYRTIGVATSPDGRTFAKHTANPVLAWFPQDMPEEGAASAAAWTSSTGSVRVLFGANTAISTTQVTADGRYAESADGLDFGESSIAIDHTDPSVFGSGDELFPVAAFESGGTTYGYYIPNGTSAKGQLCVAWGPDPSSLDRSGPVRASGTDVKVWGPAAAMPLSDDSWALFVTSNPDAHSDIVHVDVYRVSPESPTEVTGPVQVYAFPTGSRGTVLLDTESDTWFYYYRTQGGAGYGLRTAPVRHE